MSNLFDKTVNYSIIVYFNIQGLLNINKKNQEKLLLLYTSNENAKLLKYCYFLIDKLVCCKIKKAL